MATYLVDVVRTSYSTRTFKVEADSPEQAKELAEEKAYNTVFTEENADYTVFKPQKV